MMEAKAFLKVTRELGLNASGISMRKARKMHKCAVCGLPIEVAEIHYVVYYGKGLASLKFPDRVHIHCIDEHNEIKTGETGNDNSNCPRKKG